MKASAKLLLCSLLAAALPTASVFAEPDNPRIDMAGYLETAHEAAAERDTHRVSEAEFIWLSRQPGTAILDTRSAKEFQRMHVEGAVNISFAEIDSESLQKELPDKNTRVLIYCNNNFASALLTRQPRAALNLSTYVALYSYGYHNVYELAPLIDVHKTKLNLVGLKFSEAVGWLQTHRLSEEEFAHWSQEPGTMVLDPSALETYRRLHIAGATHLPRREMDAESLGKILPDKHVRILLYENNNYQAFVGQHEMAQATDGLGIPLVGDWSGDIERTCQVLREQGYSDIYALASYVRVDRSSLPTVAGMSTVSLEEPIALSLNRADR